jgi:hypothetical protein
MTAAIVAGATEAVFAGTGPLQLLVTIGFATLYAAPAIGIAAIIGRLMFHVWSPKLRKLIDADGSAHRLAAVIVIAVLGAVAVTMVAFQTIWILFRETQFGPHVVAAGNALIMGVAAVAIYACAPIGYSIVGRSFAWLESTWRRRTNRRLFVASHIAVTLLVSAAAGTWAAWRFIVTPSLGHIDVSIFVYPAAALISLGGFGLVYQRIVSLRLRLVSAAAILTVLTGCIALAFTSFKYWPTTTLDVWADCPVAGLSIDRQFDVENVRRNLPLSSFRPAETPGAIHPDIVLITIDTIRADRTAVYGGPAVTPALASLASRGSVFDWAFSPSNVTRRSMPSIFMGLTAPRIKGRVVGWALKLDPRHVTVAERLREAGYETAAFVCCDSFWGPEANTGWSRGIEHLEFERDGNKLTSQANAWIDQRAGKQRKPVFIWLHYIELHNWTTTPSISSDRRVAYDQTITTVDSMLGRLLNSVDKLAPDRAPLVIVTGDHGEALLEHGSSFHSTDLYNSQTRVPLIIAGAGITARRVAETVSGTDIVPTMLELAGFVAPAGDDMDGRSLAALIRGTRNSDLDGGYAYAAMIRDRSNPGGQRAVWQGPWKLYQRGSQLELYNFRDDPNELKNLASAQAAMVAKMKLLFDAADARERQSPFVQ